MYHGIQRVQQWYSIYTHKRVQQWYSIYTHKRGWGLKFGHELLKGQWLDLNDFVYAKKSK